MKKNGYTLIEIIISLLFLALIVGGAVKIFLSTKLAADASLQNYSISTDLGRITNALHKALSTDTKVMFASSANVSSRSEAGAPAAFPAFASKVCRNLDLNPPAASLCEDTYSMVFAASGKTSAAAVCVATSAELGLPNLPSNNINGRYIIFDPAQSLYGTFTVNLTSGEIAGIDIMPPIGPTTTTTETTSGIINLLQPLYIWNAPRAWALQPILNSANKNMSALFNRVSQINILPERCRSNVSLDPAFDSTPLYALAVEPLFISKLTGSRPLDTTTGAAKEYATNYLDASIQMPARVGQLHIKTLGFAVDPNNITQKDFGVSNCSLDTHVELGCENYPAQIGMKEIVAFNTEVTFSKRLGNHPLSVTSYQLSAEAAAALDTEIVLSVWPGSTKHINWPIDCTNSTTCFILPLMPRAQLKIYESSAEDEYALGGTSYSLKKTEVMRSLRFIMAIQKEDQNKIEEFYFALPQ